MCPGESVRDDTGIFAVICPHCGGTASVPQIKAFDIQQLIFLKCEHCGEKITKEQISNAYREYHRKEGDA